MAIDPNMPNPNVATFIKFVKLFFFILIILSVINCDKILELRRHNEFSNQEMKT